MINQNQNVKITIFPCMDELKEVVFSINPNSATGCDGMNWYFFQRCWHIIKNDLMGGLQDFLS